MADNDISSKDPNEEDTWTDSDISSKNPDEKDNLDQLFSKLVGKKLGEYEVKKEIGRGGTSIVYEAYQPSLKRKVALKVLWAPFVSDPSFIERFHHEAESAANLHHPNIVPIYDMGQKEEIYYFAMEEIEGATLAGILESKGKLSIDRAVEIIREVAKALSYAHQQEIVHRDIKPSNVMIDKTGRILVTDFGLAKSKKWEKVTATKTILGTPVYMSPEQAQGEETDLRTDIYSLGVVLYQMLTGKAPFGADEPMAILKKVIEESPQEPRKIDKKIPRDLETITLKALEKNPAMRYQTAQEFIDDINRYREGLPIKAKPTGIIGHAVKRIKRYKMLSSAVAVIIILVLGWGGYLVFQRSLESAKWQLAFKDDFERNALGKDWRSVGFNEQGVWQIEDGWLTVIKPGQHSFAMLAKGFLGDVRLEFDARVSPDSPANYIEAILAGDTSKKADPWGLMAGYNFQFSSWGGVNTTILKDGVRVSETGRIHPEPNRTYHITCEKIGNKIRLAVDKKTILEYMDLLPLSGAGYSEVGIGTTNSRVYYDNVKVWTRPLAQKTSPLSVADKLMGSGYYQEAIVEYEQLVEAYPKSEIGEEALIKIAAALEAYVKFDQALERYRQFLTLKPRSKWTCYAKERITLCLQETGKDEEAIRQARELKAEYPSSLIILTLGSSYEKKAFDFKNKGLYDQAVSSFNYQMMCVKGFKEYRGTIPWAQDRLGDLYRDTGEHEKALNAYNTVLTEYKDHREPCAWALHGLGDVYRDMGKYEESIKAYMLILSGYKDQREPCAWAQASMGDVYLKMGKHEEAIKASTLTLSEYQDKREPCVWAQSVIERIHRIMSKNEEAIKASTLTSSEHQDQRGPRAWTQVHLGDTYLNTGKYEEAIKAYTLALTEYKDQRDPCSWAQVRLGDTYLNMGKYEEAIKAYTLTLSEYNDKREPCSWAQVRLGDVYLNMGKYEEAIKAYMLVLSVYKDQKVPCAWAKLHSGDVYHRMGKYEEAIAAWRKTIEEYPTIDQGRPALIAKLMLGEISIQEFQMVSDRWGKGLNNEALYYIAAKLEMDGETEKAKEYYSKCIEVIKGKEWPYNLAVQALERLKE